MDKKLKILCYSYLIGICIACGLVACTPKPLCQIDFRSPPKVKPKPKPSLHLTQQQRRELYLCQLKVQGVSVIHVGETWKLIFPSDDIFENDTAIINPGYQPILKITANFLKTFSTINVQVAAYSDDTDIHVKTKSGGSIKDVLTTDQADAIALCLQRYHTHARLLYAVGENGKHPIAWNGSEMGRHLNRRVEISFRSYHNNIAWY